MKPEITARDIHSHIVGRYGSKDIEDYNLFLRIIDILNLCDELDDRRFTRKDDGAVNSKFTSKCKVIQKFPVINNVNIYKKNDEMKFFIEIFFSEELLLALSIVQQEKLSINASWVRMFSNSVSGIENFIPDKEFNLLDEKIKLFLIKNMAVLTGDIKIY